ncbi:MAG: FkbM family methyltransferase [Planctomycetota bacterium]|nr:FkbM family methyltransferase [Planctomycetota bacterium]
MKSIVKRLFRATGFDLRRFGSVDHSGYDLEHDLPQVVTKPTPICFDVGANSGQTIRKLHRIFEEPEIYAFEPSSNAFQGLIDQGYESAASLSNLALGEEEGDAVLINNETSTLSSILELEQSHENPFRDRKTSSQEKVAVSTVDKQMEKFGIEKLDLLNSDTQGFEARVLRGAKRALSAGNIGAVLVEINFARLYSDQSSAAEIMQILSEHGVHLVDIYEKVRKQGPTLAWCTALFAGSEWANGKCVIEVTGLHA